MIYIKTSLSVVLCLLGFMLVLSCGQGKKKQIAYSVHNDSLELWGFIDSSGNTIFEPQFEDIDDNELRSTGVYIVEENEKFGIVNKYGSFLTEICYDHIDYENHKLAIIRKNEMYGCLNDIGKILIHPKYENITIEDDIITCSSGDKKKIFHYVDGKLKKLKVKTASTINDKYLFVRNKDGKASLWNYQHKILIPFDFEQIIIRDRHCSKIQYIHVTKIDSGTEVNNIWDLESGCLLFNDWFQKAGFVLNNRIWICREGDNNQHFKLQLLNFSGKVIKEIIAKRYMFLENGYACIDDYNNVNIYNEGGIPLFNTDTIPLIGGKYLERDDFICLTDSVFSITFDSIQNEGNEYSYHRLYKIDGTDCTGKNIFRPWLDNDGYIIVDYMDDDKLSVLKQNGNKLFPNDLISSWTLGQFKGFYNGQAIALDRLINDTYPVVGIIDTTGNFISPYRFSRNMRKTFVEGMMPVFESIYSKQCKYINEKSEVSFDRTFSTYNNFYNGLVWVRDNSTDDYGYVNKTGNWVWKNGKKYHK